MINATSPGPGPLPGLDLDLSRVDPESLRQIQQQIADSPLGVWAPNPGPQAQAYVSPADELLYGGSAGGGKSSLIVGLALTQHQRTLIVRRESTQLRGMKDDIAKILGTRDGLNNQAGQWRLPTGVSAKTGIADQLIEFGGVPNPGDEEAHQGIPHDLLAFDEVTQLPEYIVDYLSTWNRSTRPNQRCRIVLASNPPTPSSQYNQRAASGTWVIRRYAPWLDPQYRDPLQLGPARPGELRWFVSLDGKEREWPDGLPFLHRAGDREEVITPKSRTFIPARVHDNPYLADSNYEASLQRLPEPLRSAMLYGDFSVTLTDAPMQLFPADWVRAATARYEAIKDTPALANTPMLAMGVDVARGGADSTVIVARRGNVFLPPQLVPTTEARTGPEVGSTVIRARRDRATIVVDANGVGASVYDYLVSQTNLEPGEDVRAYVGSERSLTRDSSGNYGFTNARSESYWKLREMLDPSSKYPISIPNDEEMITELLSMTWQEQSGRIKVIPKLDLIKILGRSPDKADALALASTVRDEDAPTVHTAQEARQRRLEEARILRDPNHPLYQRTFSSSFSRRPRWNDRAEDLQPPRLVWD